MFPSEEKLCIHSVGSKGTQPRPFMDTILTDSHEAVLKIITRETVRGQQVRKFCGIKGSELDF